LEIFVLYDTTGAIRGAGRINLAWDAENRDGSTTTERIEAILAADADQSVLYLPAGDMPTAETHRVVDGEVVPK
jgi:hypothetical protein